MSHSTYKGRRQFTRETAIQTALKCKGVNIDFEKKMAHIDHGANVGNGTWGALDYLWKEHKILPVRMTEKGRGFHVCVAV